MDAHLLVPRQTSGGTSHIPHPTSHIPHPTSHIPPPTSHLPHPTSHTPHPTSHIPHPTSHIPHPTSHIPHPTSHVRSHLEAGGVTTSRSREADYCGTGGTARENDRAAAKCRCSTYSCFVQVRLLVPCAHVAARRIRELAFDVDGHHVL